MSARVTRLLIAVLSFQVSAGAMAQSGTVRTLVGGEDELISPLIDPRQVDLVDDRLLVLESAAPFLSLYAPDGRLIQRIVRSGSGPLEMRFGAAFAFAPASRELWVFDTPNSRALVFSLTDTLAFRRSVRMPTNVVSACFLGRQLWISAYLGGMAVHRLEERDGDAQVVASAGRPRTTHPAAEHPLFKSFAAQGKIVCDEKARTVTMVSRRVGLAVSVDAATMTERTAPVPSFRPVLFEVEDATALHQRLPADGRFDQVVDARVGPDGAIVVTLGEADREHPGGGEYARYREVRLDAPASSGSVRRWRQLGAVGTRRFCYRSSPVPEIGATSANACD